MASSPSYLNKNGMDAKQSLELLEHLGQDGCEDGKKDDALTLRGSTVVETHD